MKILLVVMYIACFLIMGIVTGYAPAYYNYNDPDDIAEVMLCDDYASSPSFQRQMQSYVVQIENLINSGDYRTKTDSLDFYCRIENSDKIYLSGKKPSEFVVKYERGEWDRLVYPIRGFRSNDYYLKSIEFSMAEDQYDLCYVNWFIVRNNMYIIAITDVILLAAAVVLLSMICWTAGERPDGTLHVHTVFRLFYEVSIVVIFCALVPVVLMVAGETVFSDLASLGLMGKYAYMGMTGASFALLGGTLLFLAVCISVRMKNKTAVKGFAAYHVLYLIWKLIKWIGKLLLRFIRFIKELFTGELYKAGTAAKRFLWIDCAFIAISCVNFLMFFAGRGSPVSVFALVLEFVFLGLFLFGRFLMLRDGAVLERQIKEIYNGNYGYEEKLSAKSPYLKSSERLWKLASQYRKGIEESVKAERMKIDLVTNVSHDLKTPLTSIISYVELLSKEELNPTAQDYVKILSQKSERLKSIISDVFELAKTTSGEINVAKEQLDLTKLSYQTLAEMEDKINAAGFTVKSSICEPPVTIVSDGRRIYRIIQNLLDNALKYSLKGTRIYYTLEKRDDRAYITIKNISAYEMTFTAEEVLERFSRGDKSRTTEGSGLGLSIAQGFALACGGAFDVEIDGDMFKVILSFPLMSANGEPESGQPSASSEEAVVADD